MPFSDLGLSDKVLQAVSASGYTEPTPIQAQAIPHVLARRDVLGIAQTGTGKTAAFTLPMLTLLETGRARARMPRTLILEPTRELAAQVEENFERYGTNHKLNVALIIGGVSFADQDAKLTRGTDVLIATPGRLLDHFERGKLLLTGVELLVIDEADRMLDMGFIPDIERIVKMVPFTRQTLFFSATMPPEIERLADAFLHNPERIEVARPASTAETIVQRLVATGAEGHVKRERLRRLIRGAEELKNGIIFCNRKREVAQLQKSLVNHGFPAAALHGDMDQRARMAALDAFRSGETPLLVASDVAARGLDIPAVSHVFNFDVPHHPEDYVHRIGRTGRAGRAGHAFTLVSRSDGRSLQAIESLIGQPIPWLDGDLAALPEESEEAEPRSRHRGARSGGTERRSRGKGAGEARGESRPRRGGGQRERGEAAPRAQEAPAPRLAEAPPREARAKERREPEGDTPIGLGSHVPAFLLRPAPVKKER
ncbi:DEAD/DEAH box helicase [Methylobacterium symbioticum]|nr:DEAD/DEAH box helicase [uncultured Methylobacterium sp.]